MWRRRASAAGAVVGLCAAAARASAAAPDAARACFGGPPEVVVEGHGSPERIFLAGGQLLWAGARLGQLDLATRKIAALEVGGSGVNRYGPVDAREAFGLTGQDNIVAFDLRTNRSRQLRAGHLEAPQQFP